MFFSLRSEQHSSTEDALHALYSLSLENIKKWLEF